MMFAVVVACVLSVPACSAQVRGPMTAESHNPVARVVGLLKALSAKIEAEGDTEAALYEDFVCWGKSVIAGKRASNAAAKSRIGELEQIIADLNSGKTELTSERTDLEKEISTLEEDKESATAQRTQQKKDFDLAEKDMELAIAALEKAIATLNDATKNAKTGSLMSMREQVSRGMAVGGLVALEKQGAILQKAMDLGDRFLDKADAHFLRRLLTGDVPSVDWKKLNRKATFKMKYKARSVNIQKTLADMLKTFKNNLADARAKEADDVAAYDNLIKDKSAALDSANEAYSAMAKEKGAKAMSKSEAETELNDLKAQIEADSGFISQTQDSLATKKMEYKARKALRAGELEAISKAISILYSDDARDLMKESFASHGYLFFQQSATAQTSRKVSWNKASAVLRRLASVTEDSRLLALAPFSEKQKTAIAPAIEAIDQLIAKLADDEKSDLAKKEECESDRATDTRNAIVKSRTIDEKTDAITALTEKIAELDDEIAATTKDKMETEAELVKATNIRQDERAAYVAGSAEDEEAAKTVLAAKAVLEKFYTENKLMLVQQPVETEPGKAPTPPPETWEGAYMGATAEATGILAALNMVYEDINKDISKAKADEKAAQTAFDKMKEDAEIAIKDAKAKIDDLKRTKGDKIGEKSTTSADRAALKNGLNGVLKTIANKAKDGCDYFAVNYKLRRSNREVELDGLTKAKAYLEGGEFDKTDPDREIKPGDAAVLVQKKRLHR